VTRLEALEWGVISTRRIATRDFPREVLALVDERLGGRFCVECRELGIETPADVPLEVDHLQPLSQGGTNYHLNLTWRCRSHNRARGDRSANAAPRRPKWERRRRA
jgi:5-methylcytosine-specific restriction endonuclease McrA